MRTINRKTDSLLDWLGDWGGLLDGLSLIAEVIVHTYSVYMLNSKLSRFLIFLPSQLNLGFSRHKSADLKGKASFTEQYVDRPGDPKKERIIQSIQRDFNAVKKVTDPSFIWSYVEWCR